MTKIPLKSKKWLKYSQNLKIDQNTPKPNKMIEIPPKWKKWPNTPKPKNDQNIPKPKKMTEIPKKKILKRSLYIYNRKRLFKKKKKTMIDNRSFSFVEKDG